MRNAIIYALAAACAVLAFVAFYYYSRAGVCEARMAGIAAQAKLQPARDKIAAIERAAAEKKANTASKRAATVQAASPAVPDDSCKSAADLIAKYQRGEL